MDKKQKREYCAQTIIYELWLTCLISCIEADLLLEAMQSNG